MILIALVVANTRTVKVSWVIGSTRQSLVWIVLVPLSLPSCSYYLWFTEYNRNNIGRVSTDGVFTEFPQPARLSTWTQVCWDACRSGEEMRFVRLALGTATVIFGLLFTVAAALGGIDYVGCRSTLAQFSGSDRTLFRAVCNYDMRLTVEAGALALAFGVVTYFLLRSRWRGRAPIASTSN